MDIIIGTSKSPYRALNVANAEIRVLELAPGDFDDDLVIRLQTRTLDEEDLKYDALSYVWGKQRSDRIAIVDGHSVIIGMFLDCALRHLRGSVARLLWVDAICINQNDLDERSHQVQLMGRIYSSARAVLIWLGPERPGDDIVLSYVEREEPEFPEAEPEIRQFVKALKRVCRRPWLGRVWVVQELVLAREDPQVCFGSRRVSWAKLYRYVYWIYSQTSDGDLWPINDDLRSCFFLRLAAGRVVSMGGPRDELYIGNRQAGLTGILKQTSWCQATDPRDKIYGLLAITTFLSIQPVVRPDYSMSICDVFARATFSMIKGQECPYSSFLLPSMNAAGSVQSHAVSGSPSWVLDLNHRSWDFSGGYIVHPTHYIPKQVDGCSLMSKLRALPPCSQASEDLEQLTTVGSYIGVIAETTGDLVINNQYSDSIWGETPTTVLYNISEMLKRRQIPRKRLIHALTAKHIDNSHLIDSFLRKRFSPHHPKAQTGSRAFRVLLEILERHYHDTVFVTSEGHVGVTYHPDLVYGVRPGDIVVGLFGINFPFILRLVPGSPKDKPKYSMISICHIAEHQWGHDYVEEAVRKVEGGGKAPRWKGFAKFEMRQYVIV